MVRRLGKSTIAPSAAKTKLPSAVTHLVMRLKELRAKLEPAFSPSTSLKGGGGRTLSEGQCAAAAVLVFDQLGGVFVSANVDDESHWFNRVEVCGKWFDVDLTGDQFGRSAVQVAPAGTLYEATRVRKHDELRGETLERAKTLAKLAGLPNLEAVDQRRHLS